MSHNNKNKLVPKLRFPEFENSGKWEEEILGEICDVRDGTHDSPKYVSNGYPMITSKNLLTNGMIDFENVTFINEGDYIKINKRSKVDINDILFGMIGTIGNPVIVKKDGFAIKNVALIKNIGKLNQEFLLHQLKSNYILNQFYKVNAGGILKFIALSVIRNLSVIVPSPKEQQKIAACLSSLDEVITAESQKLEVLKDHKKGLLQNLFPKEGEKVPKLRFPEFKDSGEWEEKSFEKLFEIGNGRDYKHLESGNIPVYGSGGYMLAVNDFLYDGESVGIGRKGTIDKPMFLTGKFWTVDTLFYTHSFKECRPKYIFYVFQNINWKNHNEAGGVPSLSKTNIYKIKIHIPKPKEQQKIADTLSSIDDLINAQTQKIEMLKLHKKGLLQGLFPTLSGTGFTELKDEQDENN
ncbi:MAG: restriction endonuclease subunit S [Cyclobacteriaceae bacterium]|nr:restriction endonuclease subunit S [Cyclobacteriaceae bacterium]